MIYVTKCLDCGGDTELSLAVKDQPNIAQGKYKCECGGALVQVFTPPKAVFLRSSFPTGHYEDSFPDPVKVRSKTHAKDLCAEHGLTSKYIENDM
jgi:hypothetical protein